MDKRSVTGRTEQQSAVISAERLVFHVNGNRIGRFVLICEADIVMHAVFLFEFSLDLSQFCLEQLLMLRGDSDSKIRRTIVVSHVLLRFDKMLCEGCAGLVYVSVEFEDALRFRSISEADVCQQL